MRAGGAAPSRTRTAAGRPAAGRSPSGPRPYLPNASPSSARRSSTLPVIRRCSASVPSPSSRSSRYLPRRSTPSIPGPRGRARAAAAPRAGSGARRGSRQRSIAARSPRARAGAGSSRPRAARACPEANSAAALNPVAGPRVGVEVDLLQLLAREVGVELGGREVGVAEHLLDRAQVAAAGQQVRREGVAQGVRAHAARRGPRSRRSRARSCRAPGGSAGRRGS